MMRRANQRGAVATAVALLLLILVSLVVLSAAHIAVGEQRSMASDVQAQALNGLAELEVARGFGYLRVNAARITLVDVSVWNVCSASSINAPCGDGIKNIYDSRWTAMSDIAAARYSSAAGSAKLHFLARAITTGAPAPRREAVQVVGESLSADGRGHALIRQDAVIYPLIAQWPEATVLAARASFGGSARIVADTLSVWTAGDARLLDASLTCRASLIAAQVCGTPLSSSAAEDIDVLDVDGNQGANRDSTIAPGDIIERVLGVASTSWPSLRNQMSALVDCSALSSASAGAYWIDGDCVLPAGVAIGSASAPVVLVIANARLIADANVISGLIVLFSHDGGTAGFVPSHDATIAGALVANAAIDIASGSYVLRPNAVIASALLTGASAPVMLAPVPGAWRDY
jgi:hypothetical protein